jgi:hypothetical protein
MHNEIVKQHLNRYADASKLSYETLKQGDRVILNVSSIQQDSGHMDKGTEFTVLCFPPKIVTDWRDQNHRKHFRKYFVLGVTDTGNYVRVNVCDIADKVK